MRESTKAINESRSLRNLQKKQFNKSQSKSKSTTRDYMIETVSSRDKFIVEKLTDSINARCFSPNQSISHRHTNSWDFIFNQNSLQSIQRSDFSTPEPIEFSRAYQYQYKDSSKVQEIDSMYNLLMSNKQESKNQFTQEYMKRKVDERLREVQQLSDEKSKVGSKIIEDSRYNLHNSINNSQYKINKISPAYLRAKSWIMTDAEVLKQKMKPSSIDAKTSELLRKYGGIKTQK